MRKVQIALVGFNRDRILEPIKMNPPNKLYIFYDKKDDEYGKISRNCSKIINDTVEKIIETECIGINPLDFRDCFEQFLKVISSEEGSEITVNISSGTKLAVAAISFVSSIYKARMIYIPGKYKNLPKSVDDLDEVGGPAQTFDPFVPIKLSEIQQNILINILDKGGEVTSISSLADIIYQSQEDFVNKKNKYRAMTSYHIQQLENLGYLKTSETKEGPRKIKVILSDAGKIMGKFYRNYQ
jgi:hypothetical protein